MTSYFKALSDTIKGEKAAVARESVPEELGRMHINDLMNRHPFHPYTDETHALGEGGHPCWKKNKAFYECMKVFDGQIMEKADPDEEDRPVPLHMRHVSCYYPEKTELMQCLSRHKRAERAKTEAESGNPK